MTTRRLKRLWKDARLGTAGDEMLIYQGECPHCSEQRVLRVELNLAICTNRDCREAFDPDECLRCSRLILSGTGVFCEECQEYVDAQ